MHYEKTYTIDTRDLDCFDVCRPSALLGYLQDAAGLAAGAFGATNYDMVEKYRHCWMVARTHYRLDRPLRWGDALTVKTWHRGGDKPMMYRDFDLLVDGEKIGEALSIWILVSLDDHAITRPDRFPEFAGTDGGDLIRDAKLPKLRLPADMAAAMERAPGYSDTDGNGHVNNTRYADYLCDALGLETAPPGTFVKGLHIDYLHECKAGETLTLLTGQAEGRRYVQGTGPDGQARFQGYIVF